MTPQEMNEYISNILRPRELLTVSQWASKYRVLTSETSSEVGKWDNERTPYLVEIMDCLSKHSEVSEVYCMLPAQCGKTECGLNWVGYIVDYDPSGMLFVDASEDAIKAKFKTRLDRVIKSTPVVRKKIERYKKANEADTKTMKEFEGGYILGVGTQTSKGLRSYPAKYIFCDEVDTYPQDVGGEGDPITLLRKRQDTFIDSKLYATSTPNVKGLSLIEANYERGDKRHYYIPCPICDAYQILEFENLKMNRGEEVYYECCHCNGRIYEYYKNEFLKRGEWRATNEGSAGVRSYYLNGLYSPYGWLSWESIAQQWWEAQGDMLAGNTAVMPPIMEVKELAMPKEDIQMIDTRKFQKREWVSVLRIPLHMVGDLEKSSFNNISEQSIEYVKYAIAPYLHA